MNNVRALLSNVHAKDLSLEVLLRVGGGAVPSLELSVALVVDIETLVVGSLDQSTAEEVPGLLRETKVALPDLHLHSVAGVGTGVETVVGADELDGATVKLVESLVSGVGARSKVDGGAVGVVSLDGRALGGV